MPAWHLRPRSAPEIIDASVQLLRQHARPLLVLSAVLVIPGILVGLLNSLLLGRAFAAVRTGDPSQANVLATTFSTRAVVVLIPGLFVWVCCFLVGFAALVSAAAAAYVDGVPLEPAEALRRVRARLGVVLGSGLLTYLLVLVQFVAAVFVLAFAVVLIFGFLAAVMPALRPSPAGAAAGGLLAVAIGGVVVIGFFAAGAWLVGRYATVPAVAANEALGVRATMRRARELSRGSMGRVTALMLLVTVLFGVVAFGALILLMILLRSRVAANVVANLAYVPMYAFTGVMIAVLYYDLRVRREGLDIELLAAEIGAEHAAGEAGAAAER